MERNDYNRLRITRLAIVPNVIRMYNALTINITKHWQRERDCRAWARALEESSVLVLGWPSFIWSPPTEPPAPAQQLRIHAVLSLKRSILNQGIVTPHDNLLFEAQILWYPRLDKPDSDSRAA